MDGKYGAIMLNMLHIGIYSHTSGSKNGSRIELFFTDALIQDNIKLKKIF